MVECEWYPLSSMLLNCPRFNRYMVECEYGIQAYGGSPQYRFNRYMVECECIPVFIQPMNLQVLIDTWWNVNIPLINLSFGENAVLIDTWWNVNISKRATTLLLSYVLIDTWWNVNKELADNILFTFSF